MSRIEMIIMLIIITVVISISLLFSDSYQACKTKSDWAIVYGNKVYKNNKLSNRLKARLDAALKLYKKKKISKILVSGGIDNNLDEALIMYNYLIQKGINAKKLKRDSKGFNTSKTSQNAFRDLGRKTSVVAVTQQFHISRSILSLRNAGFNKVCGYFPNYFEYQSIYSILREIPAWIKYWLLGL